MTDEFIPGAYLTDYDEQVDAGQFADAHELSNRIQYLTQSAPYLANDPEVLSTIAQMPADIGQLGYLAASASAQLRLQGTLDDLRRMEPGRQRAVYAMMTPTQQAALQQMGYQPESTGDTGHPNPVLGAVGKIGGGIMGGVNTIITQTPIVSDVFEIMNKLQNGVNTLYRTIRTDDASELATAAMLAGGIAAAPFTGGLSLAATAGVIAGAGLAAGSAAALLTNPSDYVDALHENWNGESVFTQAAQQRARTLLRGSGLDVMARDIGWEMDPYETVRLFASTPDADSQGAYIGSIDRVLDRIVNAGDPRRQQLADQLTHLMSIPEFHDAVTLLQNSKTSFGRDVARAIGVDPGETGYKFLSGGLDAMFTIVTDPTLAATGAFKWQRALRLGVPIKAGEDAFDTVNAIAKRADEIPSIGRAYDEIAHAVDVDQPHLLWQRIPDAKGMYDDLWTYKQLLRDQGVDRAFSRDDIFDWLHDADNYRSMLAGHGVKQGFGRLLLPTYGWSIPMTGLVVQPNKLREGARIAIDFADDKANTAHLAKIARKIKATDPGAAAPKISAADNVTGAVRTYTGMDDQWNTLRKIVDYVDRVPVLRQVERSAGSVLNSLIEMMPATNSVSMVGPQSFEDIQRLVGLGRQMGMTSVERKLWFDTIMQQDNVEQRINAALSYVDTLLSSGGMRQSERGTNLADEFINKVKHRYSLGDADQFIFGERTTSRALHPYQHTFDLPVPSLKELRQYAQKGMIWKYGLRVTDAELVDSAMNNVWKPLVLLRVGFILRAGGEELLALMARAGPSALLGEFGARSIAEGRLFSTALENAEALKALPLAQREAIERMRYVAHVRPLERMFASWDWSRPAVNVLGRYSDFVRGGLERGILPGLDMAVPESRRLAAFGKTGGFRNAMMLGVDQDLIRYAESFSRVHSATIMRELSSANASVAHELTAKGAQDAGDFTMRWVDPQGELQSLGFVEERGHFKVYRKGDKFFDRMAHGGTAQILNDPLTGPAYAHVTSRWAPDTISDEWAATHLAAYRSIDDYRLQLVMRELLTGNDWRTSNWNSTLRQLQKGDEDFGTFMRGAHQAIGEGADEQAAILDTFNQWVHHRFRSNASPSGLTAYGEELLAQSDTARNVLAGVTALGPQERAWAGQFLDLWGRVPDQPILIRNFTDYRRELTLRLNDRHYDPENQQLASSLTYANQLRDGTRVAHAPLEGRTRLYVPQMTAEAYGRMVMKLRMEGADNFTAQMLQLWAQSDPYFAGLHMEQMEEIVQRLLNRIGGTHPNVLMQHAMDVASGGKHGALIPLSFLGVDDPDVAARLSQFMNASLSDTGKMTIAQRYAGTPYGQVAMLDLDDKLKAYTPMDVDGAKRPVAHPAYDHKIVVTEPERTVTWDEQVPNAFVPPYGGSADAVIATEFEQFIRRQHAGDIISTDPVTGVTGTAYPGTPLPQPPPGPVVPAPLSDPNRLRSFLGRYDHAAMQGESVMEAQLVALRKEFGDLPEARAILDHTPGTSTGTSILEQRKMMRTESATLVRQLDANGRPPRVPSARTPSAPRTLDEILDGRGRIEYSRSAADDLPGSDGFETQHLTVTKDGQPVAIMTWNAKTGEVVSIQVAQDYQRQGVATALYVHAQGYAAEHGLVAPIHSAAQTPAGKAWVASLTARTPGDEVTATQARDAAIRAAQSPAAPIAPVATHTVTHTDTLPAVTESVRTNERVTDRTIHTWALDHQYLTGRTVSLADQQIVTLANGKRAIGADPREAVAQGVDRAITDWMNHISSGGGQQRIVRGVAFRDAHGYNQIPIGTRIHMRDELYNAKGDIIEYDDPDVYSLIDYTPGENVHENWTMIGPLIRDATDHAFSTKYLLPDTRDIENLPAHIRAARAEAAPLPEMREFRGHYTHVTDLDNPPMVALGPALKPVFAPGRWDKIKTGGFENIISPAIDAIVRRPLAFHMFAEAMRENERALRWGLSPHLFGDDVTGAPGALHERFGRILQDPAAQIDMTATAEAIRVSSRLLMPDVHRQLDGLTDTEVVQVFMGGFADDVILHGNLVQQRTNATAAISDMLRNEVTMNWRTPRTNSTITQLYDQTRTAPAKRIFQLPDGRWTPRQATAQGAAYLDVPADRVSSVVADLNSGHRGRAAGVFDVHGKAKHWVKNTPPPTIGGPTWEQVVDQAYNWAISGKQPAIFRSVHTVFGARLTTDMNDLVATLQQTTRYGTANLFEWADSIKASKVIDAQPRWALPIHLDQRPIEGVLQAYTDQLGDLLARSWGEQSVQRAVAALPKPLREALDKNAWSVLSASYQAKARMGETVEALAAQRAINNSIPYLDSHEIRSQAGEYVRGFFPFMYAEQNFLKRWARTLRVAPDALRKGQLAYHGLKHLGVIRTDSQGRDWYVYPGAGLLAETVNRSLQATGGGEVLPSGVVFGSQTSTMLPGFGEQQVGVVSANPLVAVPLGWVASHFSELRPLQQSIVGQQGVAQGGLTQFIPSTIRRLWNVAGNENSNVQYASAMMSAMAVLEHNGHGLPDDATKNQLDDYVRRVRQHTRAILATQALVGFIAPGSPSIQFTGDGPLDMSSLTGLSVEVPADVFRTEYLTLVQEMGVEDGTMRYLELNPDHTVEEMMAYAVGQTTSTSGAPLPATAEAVAFADQHEGWIGQYPMAAAWMLPQPEGDDKTFDDYAYVQQTISGMRQRRTPEEFMEALKFKEGGLDYFKGRELLERKLADNADNPARRKELNDAWDEWAGMHKALHPIFTDVLEGGASREKRRRVLDEVRTALSDPSTPHVRHLAAMSELLQTFDLFEAQHKAMSESRSEADLAKVAKLEQVFSDLVTTFLWEHPELEPFWLSVLKPEASI